MTNSMDDPDRFFLLFLFNDLMQVPEENKIEVKLSIISIYINLHQYPVLNQRPQAYPNFQSLYSSVHPLQNNQHQRFRTPTPSSSQNILSNTEVDVSQSSSSSLASYVSQFNDTILKVEQFMFISVY